MTTAADPQTQDQLIERTPFRIVYAGPALTDGSMSISDLAPSIQGADDLFGSADELTNDGKTRVEVNARPASSGSFGFEGEIQQGINSLDLLVENRDTIIASIAAVTAISGRIKRAIDFLRQLRGKKPDEMEVRNAVVPEDASESNQVGDEPAAREEVWHVKVGNTSEEYPDSVVKLVLDPKFRQAIVMLASALWNPRIDSMEIFVGDETIATLTKDDLLCLDLSLASIRSPYDDAPQLRSFSMAFSIVTPNFLAGQGWELTDGNSTLPVTIQDRRFMERVTGGQESFARGDVLFCEITAVQFISEIGVKTRYEVQNVFDHKKAKRPDNFDSPDTYY